MPVHEDPAGERRERELPGAAGGHQRGGDGEGEEGGRIQVGEPHRAEPREGRHEQEPGGDGDRPDPARAGQPAEGASGEHQQGDRVDGDAEDLRVVERRRDVQEVVEDHLARGEHVDERGPGVVEPDPGVVAGQLGEVLGADDEERVDALVAAGVHRGSEDLWMPGPHHGREDDDAPEGPRRGPQRAGESPTGRPPLSGALGSRQTRRDGRVGVCSRHVPSTSPDLVGYATGWVRRFIPCSPRIRHPGARSAQARPPDARHRHRRAERHRGPVCRRRQ